MRKTKKYETLIYGITWLIVFLITILFTYKNGIQWKRIIFEWIRLLPFLLIFLLNNSLFAPKLLVKKKYTWYIAAIIPTIILAAFLRDIAGHLDPVFANQPEIPHPPGPLHHLPMPAEAKMKMVSTFNNLVISLLIIGFNNGIKLFAKRIDDEHFQAEAQKQQLKTELAFLKYQISPHFFMNTLNNIHSLIDINTEDAKGAIIKLSGLMRYLLYDSETERNSPLQKEIQFIRNYIELMQLRYDKDMLQVIFNYPEESNNITVPPLLFLSFIENAFKHSVDFNNKSTIEIQLKTENSYLVFSVKNNFNSEIKKDEDESSGVGLENVRKRLDLIYENNYSLNIKDEKNIFDVELKIPLQ